MKKAQILSALALAFALGLGVVAPVANTYAFTVADSTVKPAVTGSATQAEVETAVTAVSKQYPVYANMNAVYELLNDTKVTGADLVIVAVADGGNGFPNVYNELVTAYNDLKTPENGIGDKINDINTNDKLSFVEQINQVAALADSLDHYDAVAELEKALAGESDADLRAALENLNASYELEGQGQLRWDNNVTLATYASLVKSKVDALPKYSALATLYGKINAAQDASSKYTTAFNALRDAYQAEGVMTNDGLVALANALKVKNQTIQALVDLADPTDDDGDGETALSTNFNNYNAWVSANSVRTAIVAAETGKINLDNVVNYNLIIDIAAALKDAVPMPSLTPEQVAAELVAYTPDNPDQPTDPTPVDSLSYGNVTVKNAEGFAEGISLVAEPVKKDIAAFGKNPYALYDIHFVKTSADIADPKGPFTVEIKAVEGVDFAKSNIYYVAEDGKVEKLASTYTGNSLTFTVDHFSLYAVAQDRAEANVPGSNNEAGTPNTGIAGSTNGTASSTIAIVAGLATTLTAAGAGVVAYRNARRSGEEA